MFFYKIILNAFIAFKNHQGSMQFLKYSLSGAISATLEIGLLVTLIEALDVNYLMANAIAFVIANVVNYTLSRVWVFGRSGKRKMTEIVHFATFVLVGLLINELIFFLSIKEFEMQYVIAKSFAILCTVGWNFFTRKHFVFRVTVENGSGVR